LLGASSDVADKLQIHEMKVVNGVMEMREPISAAARSDQVETLPVTG
jgi:copper(I)-binding protein